MPPDCVMDASGGEGLLMARCMRLSHSREALDWPLAELCRGRQLRERALSSDSGCPGPADAFICCELSPVRRAKRLQALLCRFQLWKPAAFLFDKIIFNPAAVLRR